MNRTIFGTCAVIIATAALLYGGVAEAAATELHVRPDGSVVATNFVVIQKAGKNFFGRLTWKEGMFARIVVLAHDDTTITKKHGERATAADIEVGDVLDVEGVLNGAENSFIVEAKVIKDHSLQREFKSISGKVKSVDSAKVQFLLPNVAFGDTVVVANPTTTIQKGIRAVTFNDIAAGSKILSVSGMYDYITNLLTATSIEVYQDKSVFAPRNFQGILKNIAGTVPPTSLTVNVASTDYTVYLGADARVLNSAKATTSLTRYVAGDTVRFYGAIRQVNLSEVDAEVIRDINY